MRSECEGARAGFLESTRLDAFSPCYALLINLNRTTTSPHHSNTAQNDFSSGWTHWPAPKHCCYIRGRASFISAGTRFALPSHEGKVMPRRSAVLAACTDTTAALQHCHLLVDCCVMTERDNDSRPDSTPRRIAPQHSPAALQHPPARSRFLRSTLPPTSSSFAPLLRWQQLTTRSTTPPTTYTTFNE